MKSYIGFLNEAFPPPKQKPSGSSNFPSKGGGNKPPFGGKGKPFPGKPKDEEAEEDPELGNENPDEQDGQFGQDTDSMLAAQQMQAEKERAEAEAREAKAAEEDAERERVKYLRAHADAEVSSALDGKFNEDEDEVIFYPDMDSFASYTDKQRKEAEEGDGKHVTPDEDEKAGKDGEDDEDDAKDESEDDGDGSDDRKAAQADDEADDASDDDADAEDGDDESDDEEVEADTDDDTEDDEEKPVAKKNDKKAKKPVKESVDLREDYDERCRTLTGDVYRRGRRVQVWFGGSRKTFLRLSEESAIEFFLFLQNAE